MDRGSLFTLGCLYLVLAFSPFCWCDDTVSSLVDVFLPHDQRGLEEVLLSAEPYSTLETAYHVAAGAVALGSTPKTKSARDSACKYATMQQLSSLEDIYFASSVANVLGSSCKFEATAKAKVLVSESLKGKPDTKTIFYAVSSMANIEMPVDHDTVPVSLVAAVEKDDSPLSYAYAFLAASRIPEADMSVFFEQIEDIVAQADETPTTLYYEGGLEVTSKVICGIFALANRVSSKPAITEVQATKFGNFLVSSKYTSSVGASSLVATTAKVLSSNQFVVPAALILSSSQPVSKASPDLSVRLINLLAEPAEGFTVKVKSLETPAGDINPRTRTMIAAADKITFSYPMFKDTTGPGQYKVVMSTESKESSPVAQIASMELLVTVSFSLSVLNPKLSIVDKDQGVTTNTISLEYPNASKQSLQADQHSKVVMTFMLANSEDSSPITVHQAFVRLALGPQEIFFVATPDSDKLYTFKVDIAESANDFGQLSGTYKMVLIVGDFSLNNPFTWTIGNVELKFPGNPVEKEEDFTYKAKPIINHLFRVPEKRPPKVISTTFTALVILPLVFMLIMWLAMGVNINLMTGGVWGLLFHIGLGGIFTLYYCFWLQLNMFATLKYLAPIAVFTFITGNRMLKNIANARKE